MIFIASFTNSNISNCLHVCHGLDILFDLFSSSYPSKGFTVHVSNCIILSVSTVYPCLSFSDSLIKVYPPCLIYPSPCSHHLSLHTLSYLSVSLSSAPISIYHCLPFSLSTILPVHYFHSCLKSIFTSCHRPYHCLTSSTSV